MQAENSREDRDSTVRERRGPPSTSSAQNLALLISAGSRIRATDIWRRVGLQTPAGDMSVVRRSNSFRREAVYVQINGRTHTHRSNRLRDQYCPTAGHE